MPVTPVFALRLATTDQENLVTMSRVFGATSPRAFAAEMIGALCSGDQERVQQFVGKLVTAMGEQLTLMLDAHVKREVAKATKVRVKAPIKKARGKGRGRRG